MMHTKNFLQARLKSFYYAFQGLQYVLYTQRNAWIHIAVAFTVIILGCILHISIDDWRWLIFSIALVWITETINTAFEYVCDVVSPNYNQIVKRAKDIAAGAVLVCAGCASIIGLITLLPYLEKLNF